MDLTSTIEEFGNFISHHVPGSRISQWSMPPQSFDFEIIHSPPALANEVVGKLVSDFCKNKHWVLKMDEHLTGTVIVDGLDFVLSVSNDFGLCKIKGTLQR